MPTDAQATVWTATGLEPQVFLDPSGRRARRVHLAGAVAALACSGWLAGLIAGGAGFATLPALPTTLAAQRAHTTHVALAQSGRSRAGAAQRNVDGESVLR
jgi:hypothetical protein